jgi:hypothetical protein
LVRLDFGAAAVLARSGPSPITGQAVEPVPGDGAVTEDVCGGAGTAGGDAGGGGAGKRAATMSAPAA